MVATQTKTSAVGRPIGTPRPLMALGGDSPRSAFGLYVLFGATVLLELFSSDPTYLDDIGAHLPFFQDISTWTHTRGISFSIAEAFLALMLLYVLFQRLSGPTVSFDKGSLMRPLGLYMLMVGVGEIHGLTSGGDRTLSLWEVRTQVFLFIPYILTCNLVTTRRQVTTLVWILVIGTGLRGIQGVVRYVIELGGDLHKSESLMAHEQSFFFNAVLTLTPILFLYGGSRRLTRTAVLLLPFILLADVANNRRAAILALSVSIGVMLLVTALAYPQRRRRAIAAIVLLAVVFPPYYVVFKNNTSIAGMPARALFSKSNPDPRDAASNLYRYGEDADIMATVKSSTITQIIGYGYGKPMLTPQPLAQIGNIYIFWNIMPHDSILWIWMRLGTIGFLIFWFLIGTAIVQATSLVVRLQDPYLKGLALWIALMIMQQVIVSYLDLQWSNNRTLLLTGVLFALIGRLAAFADAEQVSPQTPSMERRADRYVRTRRPDLPRDLAVVNGRLRRLTTTRGEKE